MIELSSWKHTVVVDLSSLPSGLAVQIAGFPVAHRVLIARRPPRVYVARQMAREALDLAVYRFVSNIWSTKVSEGL